MALFHNCLEFSDNFICRNLYGCISIVLQATKQTTPTKYKPDICVSSCKPNQPWSMYSGPRKWYQLSTRPRQVFASMIHCHPRAIIPLPVSARNVVPSRFSVQGVLLLKNRMIKSSNHNQGLIILGSVKTYPCRLRRR